jgi:hypothetical protein
MKQLFFSLKFIFQTCILVAVLNIPGAYAKESTTTPAENKTLLKEAFTKVFANMDPADMTYTQYISKDYVQYVDGKKLNYNDFVEHLKTLKSSMKSIKVTFKDMVAEDDKVMTIHIAEGVKKDGKTIKTQFNALFQIKDHKFVLGNELSHPIERDVSNKDLASRK